MSMFNKKPTTVRGVYDAMVANLKEIKEKQNKVKSAATAKLNADEDASAKAKAALEAKLKAENDAIEAKRKSTASITEAADAEIADADIAIENFSSMFKAKK